MDMHQKRKMRQEKAKNENKEENSRSNINWDVGINGNHLENIEI